MSSTLLNPAPAVARRRCRNCWWRPAGRRRGLCHACYADAAIRLRFPSTSKYARRGTGNRNGGYALPEKPTRIRPGPEKVPVLEERARLGVSLWHPLDAA